LESLPFGELFILYKFSKKFMVIFRFSVFALFHISSSMIDISDKTKR